MAGIAEGVAASQRVEGFHPTPGMVQQAADEVARSRTDGSYDRAVEEARVAMGLPAATPVVTDVSDPPHPFVDGCRGPLALADSDPNDLPMVVFCDANPQGIHEAGGGRWRGDVVGEIGDGIVPPTHGGHDGQVRSAPLIRGR